MPKSLIIKNKIEAEKHIKIAPFKKDIRKTIAHKHHSYFEIIYLFSGSGFHAIDSRKYTVIPPVIFTVRKEQVHHWELDSEPDGFVLILKKSFVDNSTDKALKHLLMQASSFPCSYLKNDAVIRQLFNLLLLEYDAEKNNLTPVIEGLLKALLAKMLELAKPALPERKGKPDLFQAYQELLSSDASLKNNVAYYADILGTSPQNLNAVCRKAVDQSAAGILSDFIISEAKRLLLYTSNTVAAIALSLSFSDASHFVKYFKRITGNTPQAFRAAP
jgi:AraC-like DNA-binding protein